MSEINQASAKPTVSKPASTQNSAQNARSNQAKTATGNPVGSFNTLLSDALNLGQNDALNIESAVKTTDAQPSTEANTDKTKDIGTEEDKSLASTEATSTPANDAAAQIMQMAQYQQQAKTTAPVTENQPTDNLQDTQIALLDDNSGKAPGKSNKGHATLKPGANGSASDKNGKLSSLGDNTKQVTDTVDKQHGKTQASTDNQTTTALNPQALQSGEKTSESFKTALDNALPSVTGNAALQNTNASGSNPVTTPMQIDVPVYSPQFPAAVHDKVSLAIKQNMQEAEINLNPGDMGPIKIRIKLGENKETTSIEFLAQNPETRRILEGAASNLRDLFNQSGVALDQMTFNQSSAGQDFARASSDHASDQSSGQRGQAGGAVRGDNGNTELAGQESSMRTVKSLGLVDTFA
ncbi:flagellar hook-length control protein FliK [Ampullimonas aquatilis]|uniref:flagellar hook-length control protein FliK n=1 Tax=Ampullimonas aquatilis TaxID=1341549 RepID=UPI003C71C7AA